MVAGDLKEKAGARRNHVLFPTRIYNNLHLSPFKIITKHIPYAGLVTLDQGLRKSPLTMDSHMADEQVVPMKYPEVSVHVVKVKLNDGTCASSVEYT
ncbi:hypothetical protein Taro_000579 [Colocasia esculenta]|uniref:Uncharacterized protein n=1 Tax=Colocasia esculenta TaxID=4460 RepID=A0A843TB64_COLES|nr:hypothetical protein [Colocasia esculenta]